MNSSNGMNAPRSARWLAGILAVTGTIFLPFTLFPLTTPGFAIWGCWLLIAIGWMRPDHQFFWAASAAFNFATKILWLWMRGWSLDFEPLIVYTYAHLSLASIGSLVVLGLIPRRPDDQRKRAATI